MNATKERFKTWDNTLARVEELEAGAGDSTQLKVQISSLTAELAARNTEIKLLKTAGSSQQSAAAVAPATSQPPTTKPIDLDQMTLSELARAADEAGLAGDHAKANLYYQAYSARKLNRC
jgi:hypothetical protein